MARVVRMASDLPVRKDAMDMMVIDAPPGDGEIAHGLCHAARKPGGARR